MRRQREPYVPPPDALPLSEVVRLLVEKSREVNMLDDHISEALQKTAAFIRAKRPTGYPVDVPFPPWGKLAWSGRKGRWRFVVIDDEECEDLNSMPRSCRVDACHVLRKLVDKMGLLPKGA